MKIIYSAFECNPGIGSDAYVGWSWAKQMSNHNEVHVLTNCGNRPNIEKYLKDNKDVTAIFHYVELPYLIQKVLTGRKGYFATYIIWQWFAYQEAKKLHKKINFDVAHHVSIADFRVIGFLWKLGIPFVYGPVGGGQETPYQLNYYVRNYKKNEKIRSLINKFAISLPVYKKGIQSAARVFVSNDETIAIMKKYAGEKIRLIQMCELGIDQEYLEKRESFVHQSNECVHVLVSGRMMYRKGMELLLDALTVLDTDVPFVVDMYGGGHQIAEVEQQIIERHLDKKVIMHGKIPFDAMPEVYKKSDLFVLPSLRETTGTAVIEAMANKLPVVALKQNGVKFLVQNDAGILAEIESKDRTIQNFANALRTLIEDPEKRRKMGSVGFERLKTTYTWEIKAKQMQQIYKQILEE